MCEIRGISGLKCRIITEIYQKMGDTYVSIEIFVSETMPGHRKPGWNYIDQQINSVNRMNKNEENARYAEIVRDNG